MADFEPKYLDLEKDMIRREWIRTQYDTLSQSFIFVNGTAALRYAIYTKGQANMHINNTLSASNTITASTISVSNQTS